jgi:hypothetical protein
MSLTTHAARLTNSAERAFPVLTLLNPGRHLRAAALALAIGTGAGFAAHTIFGQPRWTVAAIALLVLLPVGVLKWRDDRRQYGATVMLLSMLLATQGVHTIEHIVQWAQYYLLMLPARQSTGLVSAANAEWVHFVWNWWVLGAVALLVRGGMRNWLAYALLAVTVAHAVEHTYLFTRYNITLGELRELGVTNLTAQGLAGIVGRDGWLARSPLTQNTFLCTLPGLTTAMRLDVHFWWNVVEMLLLLGAGSVFLRGRLGMAIRELR